MKTEVRSLRGLLVVLIAMLVLSSEYLQSAETVEIATFVQDGEQRRVLLSETKRFRQEHPGLNIRFRVIRADYNQQVKDWLLNGEGPDIVYWNAGAQIHYFAKQNLLQNLNFIRDKIKFDSSFPPAAINAVTFGGHLMGIPSLIHLWGFYYRESSFRQWGVKFPESWGQLLNLCVDLRKRNIDLFSFSGEPKWMTHGWFDYLVLRIHGIEFYHQLVTGKISYQDERVKTVFAHWLELVDNQCFFPDYKNHEVTTAFPRVYHRLSASILSYKTVKLPKAIKADLKFAPFPRITKGVPLYSVAPVDAFVVPSYVKITDKLEKVLMFLAHPEFQAAYNQADSRIPANKFAQIMDDPVVKIEAEIFRSSPDGIQFFDREAPLELAEKTPEIFMSFIDHRDIDRVTAELEALKKKVFSVKGVASIHQKN